MTSAASLCQLIQTSQQRSLYRIFRYYKPQANMIQEEYCTFETAKLLKEAGFPQIQENDEIRYYYNEDGEVMPIDYADICHDVARPTQAVAMRWLRLNYSCNIAILMTEGKLDTSEYFYILQRRYPDDGYKVYYIAEENAREEQYFLSHEAAAEAGIRAACEYVIQNLNTTKYNGNNNRSEPG